MTSLQTPKHHRALTRGLMAAMVLALGLPVSSAMAETVQYQDGASTRSATLQSDLVAEFAPASSAGARSVSGDTPFVTLYKVSPSSRSAPLGARQSPVFREGTSPAGRLMALPGGVIVNFKAEWSDADVSAWISGHGYQVRQHLQITGNWYVIDTLPGRAALLAASAIQATGDVVSATPNWWVQTVAR